VLPVTVGPDDLTGYLGHPRHTPESSERTAVPGVATGLAVTGAGGDLNIGVIPYEAPSKIKDDYGQFGDYLGKSVGEKATIFVSPSYLGIGQALMADQIDCAYLNPLSYVLFTDQMRSRPDALVPLAMPHVHGSLYYYGVIFVRADSGITSIAQLKGKRMAFNEATSTSGYIYPYAYLKSHGVNPDKDFSAVFHANANGVVPAVLNHSADAGAVFEEALTNPKFLAPESQKQLRVLVRVGPIANGMFVARGNLDPVLIAKLKAAFVSINTDPAGKVCMKKMDVQQWETANDAVFDPVRVTAKDLGLNLKSLDVKKQ